MYVGFCLFLFKWSNPVLYSTSWWCCFNPFWNMLICQNGSWNAKDRVANSKKMKPPSKFGIFTLPFGSIGIFTPTIWIQKYLKPPSLPTNHLQLRPSAFCCSSDRRHGSFPFRGFPRRSRTWCFSCLESRGSFNVYIYTPRKTNVTGWKTNHLKMHFLWKMVI